jgi:hypothetical protein
MKPIIWRVIAAAALLSAAAEGQLLVWEDKGMEGGRSYGLSYYSHQSIAGLGDIDGDGYDDLACIGADLSVLWRSQQLIFVSGQSGQVVRTRPAPRDQPPRLAFDTVTSAGDMDGDGVPDYAVTISDVDGAQFKTVQVCSGVDDRELWRVEGVWRYHFGESIAGGMDLNADGLPDLVVLAWRDLDDGMGTIYAYDHRGELLWKIRGRPDLSFGNLAQLARIGDVDGDGAEDVLTGATDGSGQQPFGLVVVLSGRDGSVVTIGRAEGIRIGYFNAGAGDIDGDGVPDIATTNGAYTGMVFSGRTGSPIWRWEYEGKPLEAISAGADLDRDGIPDVVLGAPNGATGTLNRVGLIFARSGRDGTELFRIASQFDLSPPLLGSHLATLRRPGEPFATFAELSPKYGALIAGALGRLRAFRGAVADAEVYAPGCGSNAGAPRIGIRAITPPKQHAGVRVHLSGAPPGRTAVLLLGFSRTAWLGQRLPLPLDAFGLPGCALATSIDVLGFAMTGTQGVDAGHASFDLPGGVSPWPVDLFGQWFVLDPQTDRIGTLSDALRWKL